MKKKEDILIPNKPSVEDITDLFGLGKDYTYWCRESRVAFRDLYVRIGYMSFYENLPTETGMRSNL